MTDPRDVIELTRSLLEIPSMSGEEGPLSAFVAERWRAERFEVKEQPIPATVSHGRGSESRKNVLAWTGRFPPKVVLTTHLDTVPPFLSIREDDEWMYGRGTCDAKGIFAAMWCALRRLRERGVDGVGLMGIVGEETDSVGAKRAREMLPSTQWIINGEPTDLLFASGAKGVLMLRLKAAGVAGHSAYPELGDSAIHGLIHRLSALLTKPLSSESEYGPTTINVGKVSGGAAINVIAPSAEADVILRLGTASERIFDEVRAVLGDNVEIEVLSRSEPHRIFVPEGRKSALVRFGSDVPHLQPIGTPLMVGPGSIHDAHTDHEKVRKSDLVAAVEFYEQLAIDLLARATAEER